MTTPADRLVQLRKEHGFESAADFARHNGINPGTQRSYENGNRDISRKAAIKLAHALGTTPGYILYGQDDGLAEIKDEITTSPMVPLIGNVQAGAFIEAFEEEPMQYFPAFHEIDRLHNAFCLRVIGDSMDLVYPEGTILYCQKLDDYPADLRNGKRVIIKRRAATDLFEATVKEYSKVGNTTVLKPLSSNKKHQVFKITNNHTSGDGPAGARDVQVWAVVVGSYSPEP